jgi:hypothetical protein
MQGQVGRQALHHRRQQARDVRRRDAAQQPCSKADQETPQTSWWPGAMRTSPDSSCTAASRDVLQSRLPQCTDCPTMTPDTHPGAPARRPPATRAAAERARAARRRRGRPRRRGTRRPPPPPLLPAAPLETAQPPTPCPLPQRFWRRPRQLPAPLAALPSGPSAAPKNTGHLGSGAM